MGAGAPTPAAAQTTLRIGLAEDPDALDPTTARTFVGRIAFAGLCDKLFDIDTNLRIVPQLATEFAWDEDNKTLTIRLRPNVFFHDGERMDGICGNLMHIRTLPEAALHTLRSKAFRNLLGKAFSSWPNYSGKREFPIPDPTKPSDLFAARRIYYAYENLWKDCPYGNLRRELCLHVAGWLEANKSEVLPFFEEKFHD